MAEGTTVSFQPPTIDWDSPDVNQSFKRFKRYAELILKTPAFATKSDADKANFILIWLGPSGVEIFDNLTMTDADRAKPAAILDAIASYLEPKTNFRLARLQLRDMTQATSEPVDAYLTRLKAQASKCEFLNEALKNSELIDQLIKGTAHRSVRRQLLDKNPQDLTLNSAADIARVFESTQRQLRLMNPQEQPGAVPVAAVKKHEHKCRYCGLQPHDRSTCPARTDSCQKCQKKGHWAKVCESQKPYKKPKSSHKSGKKTQKTKNIDEVQETFEKLSFGTIHIDSCRSEIKCGDRIHRLKGKVDTGAQGNLIPARVYRDICRTTEIPLQKSSARLCSYTGEEIPQIGIATLQCSYENTPWKSTKFFITDNPGCVIFGLPMCESLGLINLNCMISSKPDNIRAKYPDRFSGIGKLKGTYTLALQDDARPVIHPPRRVPIQLREQIKAELERMTKLEVIRPVVDPTDWVSSATYVKKKDGSLRICLDPRDLNRALKRGTHLPPMVEDVAHQLRNAKFFSKLDARSGYWAVCLDEESQLLTTFNTPFGRYCFQRLPFGLKTSQDVFQHAMDQTLIGLQGVIAIADDIVVFGNTEQEHDKHLHALMRRAREKDLVFKP